MYYMHPGCRTSIFGENRAYCIQDFTVITNRNLLTGFWLIPTSMTLNDLERRNSRNFAFFSPNSIALLANYVTVVEDRPIMSVKYCLPVPVFHFWLLLIHPVARSLCSSWATCFYRY